MVSFSLSAGEHQTLAMAHEQAEVYRRYARIYDQDIRLGDPPASIPEEEDFPHVRDFARRLNDSSGYPIIDALIHLEEIWGGKPYRSRGRHGDTMDFALSNKVIEVMGTAEQIARFGDLDFCYGVTEPGAGSDPAQVRSTAVRDPATGDWIINGEKVFISLGEAADAVMVLVRAIDADGNARLSNFIIEKGTPGFTVAAQHRKMGLRISDTTNLVFEDVRVPDFNHLNGDLRRTLLVLNSTRSMVAMAALGHARSVLEFLRTKLAEQNKSVDYRRGVRRRSAVEARLIRLEAHYDAVWLASMRAKWLETETGVAPKVEASIAKALGGRFVREATQSVMELVGPESLSEEYLLEKHFRDSRIIDIYEGAGEIQRILLARELFGFTPKEFN